MPRKPTELVFPLRGINEGWGFNKQPEGTTPDAQNVVPFDTLDGRIRGGQRWGTSKFYSSLWNGAAAIQRISSVTDILSPGDTSTDTFTQGNGVLSDTSWYLLESSGANLAASTTVPRIVSNKISNTHDDGYAAEGWRTAISKTLVNTGNNYEISVKMATTLTHTAAETWGALIVRAPVSFPVVRTSLVMCTLDFSRSGSDYTLRADLFGDTYDWTDHTMTPGSGDYLDPTWWQTARTVKVVVAGNDISLYVEDTEDVLLHSGTVQKRGTDTAVGFLTMANTVDCSITMDDFTLVNNPSQSGRAYKLVVISGGDVFYGIVPTILSAATSGTNALTTSGRLDMQTSFDKMYFADGDPANYKYFDNSDNTVYTWTPTSGTLPMGSDETAVNITAATPATPSFTVAEDWSGRAAGDYLLVAGSTSNDGFYTVVSTSGSGPTVLTVNEAVPDNTADGTIQYQNLGCKIIKQYRGRMVMAGLTSDAQNWFMSAAGNSLNWDYSSTPISATMAVAGNSTSAGRCPDIITCLAPYSDDIMFIGGDHTIWMLRGDPAESGRIDNISYQTGIAGPEAYTFDPNGVFYFFGSGALWRMAIGGVPEPLSRNRMDSTFGAISLVTNTIHLAWDNVRHGLFIFVVPSVEGSTTHYYWDERTDGFWKLVFPDAQGPTTAFAFDGDNPDDNTIMLGGWDGYIRQLDSSATDDDGTAISSYVLYPPISVGGPTINTRISSITAVLDTDSDDVVLTVYAEDTVQKTIEASTIRFARTISAGRTKMLGRIAGNAIMIKLSNSVDETTWAVESIVADIQSVGHTRKDQL